MEARSQVIEWNGLSAVQNAHPSHRLFALDALQHRGLNWLHRFGSPCSAVVPARSHAGVSTKCIRPIHRVAERAMTAAPTPIRTHDSLAFVNYHMDNAYDEMFAS